MSNNNNITDGPARLARQQKIKEKIPRLDSKLFQVRKMKKCLKSNKFMFVGNDVVKLITEKLHASLSELNATIYNEFCSNPQTSCADVASRHFDATFEDSSLSSNLISVLSRVISNDDDDYIIAEDEVNEGDSSSQEKQKEEEDEEEEDEEEDKDVDLSKMGFKERKRYEAHMKAKERIKRKRMNARQAKEQAELKELIRSHKNSNRTSSKKNVQEEEEEEEEEEDDY